MRIKHFKLLPEAADADVAWALNECVARQSLTMVDGYNLLAARLTAKGVGPIPSRTSFHRLVVDCRENGIPPRYQVGPKQGLISARRVGLDAEALARLVDDRIEAAFRRRGL
jgi:hypothetical protein